MIDQTQKKNIWCVFQPANVCFACYLLFKIIFFHQKEEKQTIKHAKRWKIRLFLSLSCGPQFSILPSKYLLIFFLPRDGQAPLGIWGPASCRILRRILHLPPQANEVCSFEWIWLISLQEDTGRAKKCVPFSREYFAHGPCTRSNKIPFHNHR